MTGWSIRAYVGANGGGKTLGAVESMVIPAWKRGRPVVSNLVLDPVKAGFDAGLYIRLESWTQLPDLRGTTVVLDEISTVLPSRQHAAVPPQLLRVMNQLRKGDVDLGWTAPNWARCDVLLREVTQAVTVCRGFLPDQWQRDERGRRTKTAKGRARKVAAFGWKPNRLFCFRTYDAIEFDEFTYARVEGVRPRLRKWYWRPAHIAHQVYDTNQQVLLLDHLDDVGRCVNCGGQRSVPRCKCKPDGPATGESPNGAARSHPSRLHSVGH